MSANRIEKLAELVLPWGWVVFGSISLALLGGVLWLGYEMGLQQKDLALGQMQQQVRAIIAAERGALERAEQRAEAKVGALARRLGQMQARMLRLEAVGERIVALGELDAEEFNFAQAPALGGPDEAADRQPGTPLDGALMVELEDLGRALEDRAFQLGLLQEILLGEQLREQTQPKGRPVRSGWISSGFGKRRDPFSGKQRFHKGIDFAGKAGSDVVAVADGVVTKAERSSGYGYLIELDHGNGYRTRYGHNAKLLVAQGERVEQGQVIGSMGSSGKSTGPHVHFEVIRSGKIVNPQRYVRSDH